jgi:hypothetical protein
MRKSLWAYLVAVLLTAAMTSVVFGLGSDHPSDRPVNLAQVPAGLNELINRPGRVHGYFVNEEDRFFYAGSAQDLTAFLEKYAELKGIVAHRLTIHAGKSVAKSPWDKGDGKPCDWMLEVGNESWRGIAADASKKPDEASKKPDPQQSTQIVEMHIWTDGAIKVADLKVPKGVEVVREAAPKSVDKAGQGDPAMPTASPKPDAPAQPAAPAKP